MNYLSKINVALLYRGVYYRYSYAVLRPIILIAVIVKMKTNLMLNLKLTSFITVVIFSGCIVIPTYTSRILLKATHQNEHEMYISNVLIIGTGPAESGIYLDNLTYT
jgi:hypothetical protein